MESDENEWSRLKALLEKETWDKNLTVFIVAGVDPASAFPKGNGSLQRLTGRVNPKSAVVDPTSAWVDGKGPLQWLPGGLLPEWAELTRDQVKNRAALAVRTAEMKLLGLPWSMTPFAWLCESTRRQQVQLGPEFPPYVHPGVVPPWLPLARLRPELQLLVPPEFYPQSHRARERHARVPSASRPLVQKYWDEWNSGERKFDTKIEFVNFVMGELDAHSVDAIVEQRLIGEWIDNWERYNFSPYGIMDLDDGEKSRVYGLLGLTSPVKTKKLKTSETEDETEH